MKEINSKMLSYVREYIFLMCKSVCVCVCVLCAFLEAKSKKKHLLNFEYVSFELTQTHLFMFRVDFFVLSLFYSIFLIVFLIVLKQSKFIIVHSKYGSNTKPHHFAKHTKFQCILSEQLAIMFYSHVLVNKLPLHPVQRTT